MEDAYALVESLYIRSIYVYSHARENGQFHIQYNRISSNSLIHLLIKGVASS